LEEIDEEALREFLIEKEPVDEELWEKIKNKAEGNAEEKESAISLIFTNYVKIPSEADEILKTLALKNQPLNVRKKLATQMSKDKASIPGGLYFSILTKLSEDPNEEIKKQVLPIKKEFLEPLNTTITIINRILAIRQKPIYKNFQFNWLTFLPIDQMLFLLRLHKNGKDQEIEKMLVRVSKDKSYLTKFEKDLSSIKILRNRLGIINSALEAHSIGNYELSIPSLLSQIEGILWDIASIKNIAYGQFIVTRNGRMIECHGAYNLVDQTHMYDLMDWTLADFFLKAIYTKTFRHGILHGRITNYAKEEDSMKLVMLLRALSEIAKKEE